MVTRVDLRDAEVRPRGRVAVLVVRREPVRGREDLPPGPLPAHPLSLDRARRVGREHHPVVGVGLVDDAAGVVLHEVARHAQVMGDQVGHPVGGHLIRHREDIGQVLDRQVAALHRLAQERHRGLLRHQHRGGEVVGLHPLAQEVGEVARRLVAEQEVAQRLEDHRLGRVPADWLLLDVDAAQPQVGQGPDGPGKVIEVTHLEPVVAHHRHQHALRQRAAVVVRARPYLCRQGLRRRLLDAGEVVALLAHGRPQRGVGLACLLRRAGRLGALRPQLGGERDDVLKNLGGHPRPGLQHWQPERLVGGVTLGGLQRYLQLRAAAGRLLLQQLGHRHRQRRGQLFHQRQARLAFAVLQQRQHRRRAAHLRAELGERHPARPPQVPDPLAQCCQV
jgi:hypothetical protein